MLPKPAAAVPYGDWLASLANDEEDAVLDISDEVRPNPEENASANGEDGPLVGVEDGVLSGAKDGVLVGPDDGVLVGSNEGVLADGAGLAG